MEQNWFEMRDIRKRKLANAVWIPLRAIYRISETGKYGYADYRSEFYGAGSIAVPLKNKKDVEKLGWTEVGINHNNFGYVRENGKYIPSDIYEYNLPKFTAIYLVLDQVGNGDENPQWHLHQDFVITLGLKREGDSWVRPEEDYIEVAKLHRNKDGDHNLLEIRASHLKDYLCARKMGLYITSYRERKEVFEKNDFSWPKNLISESNDSDRWEGRIMEIHEGGEPYGAKMAVFHVSRTDVDSEEDVPRLGLPTDENVISKSWTKGYSGRKLYLVMGELWRNEWIDPASQSPIVRGDKIPATIFFITDAEGKQENRDTLVAGGKWLWFKPDVICTLAHRRGGFLRWYTRDTGSVSGAPSCGVHFGINSLGFVNVYAKDIALLPDWQQKIWAGFNISPEGKVSEELLASQARAEPADTQAPEAFLEKGLSLLNSLAVEKLGINIIRPNIQISDLVANTHRFRATNKVGLFALAKDIARLTADSIDAAAIQTIVRPPKETKWRSLKSLENLIALKVDPKIARALLSPLFGVYELRLADAHLPSSEIDAALALVGIDQNLPFVLQGYQLLYVCVSSIYKIADVLRQWDTLSKSE